jgi:hypothetical protein
MLKKLLPIPLMVLLAGCPPPRYIEIYNNSGGTLNVYGRSVTTEIRAQKSKRISVQDFIHHEWYEGMDSRMFVWMKIGPTLREYQITRKVWGAVPQRADRTDFVQIEANGDVVYLEGESRRPSPPDGPQPEGFPLHGTTPDWAGTK